MGWIALRFLVGGERADLWAEALLERGAVSVDIADADAGTPGERPVYAEPGEEAGAHGDAWARNELCALFDEGADPTAALAQAAGALGEPLPTVLAVSPVEERDWVRATQSQFAPLRVASGLWVVPTWADPPEPGAINLRLDPGVAFGTGTHATTRLCLEWLVEHPPAGASVLDYGCGSGILAIAAARLGARAVVGVDIDAQAVAAARANARANAVPGTFVLPDALAPGRFDVVLANILARPLAALAPLFAGRCRVGGALVLAGLLDEQADDLAATYEPWFMMRAWRRCEGWTALAGVRRPARA